MQKKIEQLNNLLRELRIYDDENPEWYLDKIVYSEEEDRYYFVCDAESLLENKTIEEHRKVN